MAAEVSVQELVPSVLFPRFREGFQIESEAFSFRIVLEDRDSANKTR